MIVETPCYKVLVTEQDIFARANDTSHTSQISSVSGVSDLLGIRMESNHDRPRGSVNKARVAHRLMDSATIAQLEGLLEADRSAGEWEGQHF